MDKPKRKGARSRSVRSGATRAGTRRVESEIARLLAAGREILPFATIDHDRARRTGSPEVVYGSGKTAEQVVAIAERIVERSRRCLVTRADEPMRVALRERFPKARVNDLGRTVFLGRTPTPLGRVCVVSAGTSDLPVAEEAAETLLALGSGVERLTDVGVAGLHRVLAGSRALRAANAVVVVAGMEGALPSVVGGLTRKPIFAVPTSVGYGASLDGLAALLSMLNSCAPGVAVLNIDNGFGAAFAAHRVNLPMARAMRRRAKRNEARSARQGKRNGSR